MEQRLYCGCGEELAVRGTEKLGTKGEPIWRIDLEPCQRCRDMSYNDGWEDGQNEGYDEIYQKGYNDGQEEVHKQYDVDLKNEYKLGYEDGVKEGLKQARYGGNL